jgi:hypothetical protein
MLWWLDVPERVARALDPPAAAPSAAYVDRDGWMLTPDDVPAFEALQRTE